MANQFAGGNGDPKRQEKIFRALEGAVAQKQKYDDQGGPVSYHQGASSVAPSRAIEKQGTVVPEFPGAVAENPGYFFGPNGFRELLQAGNRDLFDGGGVA